MLVTRGLAQKVGRVFGFGAARAALDGEVTQATQSQGDDRSWPVAAARLPLSGGGLSDRGVTPVAQAAEFGGMHVLVADDSEINRTILRTFLERLGFEVTLAADGVEAVDRWQPVHDLVCLDIEMPRLDGMNAFLHIKDEASRRGLPVPMALAVTVNALTHEVTTYLQAGFDACLPKPFSRGDLVDLLRRRWPASV